MAQRITDREDIRIWLYAYREWLRDAQSFRHALAVGDIRLPADHVELVIQVCVLQDALEKAIRA